MHGWTRLWRVLAGGLLLAATAVGTATGAAASPRHAPQFHGTVVVGVLGSFTGNESFLGPDLVTGVQAAADEINAAGGILGKKVVVVTADDAGDAVDAVPAFRELVAVHHPAVIIGPFSSVDVAVLPLIAQYKVPTFEQGGTTQLDTVKVPYFWRTNASDDQEGTADAYWAIHEHWMTAAFAYTTAASAQTLMDPTRKAYVAHGGEVLVTVNLVPDASSYRTEILKLMAAHPEVVFFQQDPQTAGTFFSEAAELGFDRRTHWLGTDVEYSSDVFKALGPKIATTNFVFTNNSTEDNAASRTFAYWYSRRYHTTTPAVSAPQGYDALITAALAMTAAHSTVGTVYNSYITTVANPPGTPVYDYATGVRLLREGKKINYEGVGSTVDFNRYHNVIGPFGVYRFTASGQIVPVANISSAVLEQFQP